MAKQIMSLRLDKQAGRWTQYDMLFPGERSIRTDYLEKTCGMLILHCPITMIEFVVNRR